MCIRDSPRAAVVFLAPPFAFGGGALALAGAFLAGAFLAGLSSASAASASAPRRTPALRRACCSSSLASSSRSLASASSAPLPSRRRPMAASHTCSTRSTGTKVMPLRSSSGTSSRSASLRLGRITVVMPARWAARVFALRPPMGSTWPVRVTSPVIATSALTGVPVTSEQIAVAIVGGLDHLARELAADGADLALQVTHAGFARVARDDLDDRLVAEGHLLRLEAVGVDLPRHQIVPGDVELLLDRVPGEEDDLHAVAQRSRDGFELVGRGDEQHLAEVERQVHVVVAEGDVLLRVEHLEQSARRVAAPCATPAPTTR